MMSTVFIVFESFIHLISSGKVRGFTEELVDISDASGVFFLNNLSRQPMKTRQSFLRNRKVVSGNNTSQNE